MRRNMKRMLCLLLCAVVLLQVLPVISVSAAGDRNRAAVTPGLSGYSVGRNEFGDLTFSSYEDLKTILNGDYLEYEYALYVGDAPLTIKDSLYIHPGMTLIVDHEIRIPAGVTLEFNALFCRSMTVAGSAVCGTYLSVYEALEITGELRTQGQVMLETGATLTGAEKLVFLSDEAMVTVSEYVHDFPEIKAALARAQKAGTHWDYEIVVVHREAEITDTPKVIVLESAIRIPRNVNIRFEEGIRVTVPTGCKVELEGYWSVFSRVSIQGELVNNGYLDIFYDDGGLLKVTGTYSGNGVLWINSYGLNSPEQAVEGLNPKDFFIILSETGYDRYWVMQMRGSLESEALRIYGANRYETAFKTADALKEALGIERFDAVMVASGTSFADALSGSYLAAEKRAPILLYNGKSSQAVLNYIHENLIPGGTVYLLGGTAAIPASFEQALEGYTVKRLGGANRYETNLAILQEAAVLDQEILICTGKDFPDSLSASAVRVPILLVSDRLTPAQTAFLERSAGGHKIIVGGTTAVSTSMENILKNYGTVERIGGSTRYETSVLLAKRFFTYPGTAVLAYGNNFPDGLCAGPLAASLGVPLILTAGGKEASAKSYAQQKGIFGMFVLGGTGLIPDKTVRSILQMPADGKIQVME